MKRFASINLLVAENEAQSALLTEEEIARSPIRAREKEALDQGFALVDRAERANTFASGFTEKGDQEYHSHCFSSAPINRPTKHTDRTMNGCGWEPIIQEWKELPPDHDMVAEGYFMKCIGAYSAYLSRMCKVLWRLHVDKSYEVISWPVAIGWKDAEGNFTQIMEPKEAVGVIVDHRFITFKGIWGEGGDMRIENKRKELKGDTILSQAWREAHLKVFEEGEKLTIRYGLELPDGFHFFQQFAKDPETKQPIYVRHHRSEGFTIGIEDQERRMIHMGPLLQPESDEMTSGHLKMAFPVRDAYYTDAEGNEQHQNITYTVFEE